MLLTKDFEAINISPTELQRNIASYMNKLKGNIENSYFITKKNKVEAVLVNPKYYDYLLDREGKIEQLSIALAIEKAKSDKVRFAFDSEEVQSLLRDI
jgi:PHD/YefM family antitoxin component YafN of YafNO toxin-antitoxin module